MIARYSVAFLKDVCVCVRVFPVGATLLNVFQPGKRPFQDLRGPGITFLSVVRDSRLFLRGLTVAAFTILPEAAKLTCVCVDTLSSTW